MKSLAQFAKHVEDYVAPLNHYFENKLAIKQLRRSLLFLFIF